ncbi:DUF5984 family protein [Catellatospora coxensis]|uniref:Uncharacterized protein n=1 Tax=Catellatospora coxensis TaxID=310354 RepID=A0A8J3KTY8_9ACTN|nr:DUF5984 family protein [Catellatospora coxensis]GIG09027.1 hypothetical protein Cco03nite_57270 [Catellatospora coxensis]
MSADTIRIHFELRPLAEVKPWGSHVANLHWFGLTDGWYWIEAGGHQLLRYRDEAVARWELERPYPDYYVVRLWEDLLILRWALHEPVPDDLIELVAGSWPSREWPDEWSDAADAAIDLAGDHSLYLSYLVGAPILTFWRHITDGQDLVSVDQHIRPAGECHFDGPERLVVTVPTAEFFAAVADFDRRLIAAMDERVTELEKTGPPPGVELDLEQLRLEHGRRSGWLAQRLAAPRSVDWARVRAGVAEMTTWPLRTDAETEPGD